MTDREKAIKDLEDVITTAECIKGLSDDAGITISLDKIESLRFALGSIKADGNNIPTDWRSSELIKSIEIQGRK